MRKQTSRKELEQDTTPDYFTIAELANYSRIGRDTLYKAVQKRELKHAAFGRKKVVSRQDFEAWFKGKKRLTADEILEKSKPTGHLDG